MQFDRWPLSLFLALAMACSNSDLPAGANGGGQAEGDDNTGGASGNNDDGNAGGGGAGGDSSGGGGAGSGGGGGSTGGTGGGGNGGGGNGYCEELVVATERAVPDVMIVLDRSGSMGRGVDRWTPSVNAIGSLTDQLEDVVRFGLMMFPSDESCGPGNVSVSIRLGNAATIQDVLARTTPSGGTPTSQTLEIAYEAIGAGLPPPPDEDPTAKFVLLVTDGQPTCPNASGFVDAPRGVSQAEHDELLALDHQLTLDAIDALREAGVLTYVIGYDAALDPQLANALSEFAEHGGTGDYHPVQNEAELLAEFEKISGEVVSCSFTLEEEPADISYVEVRLDGVPLNLNDENGWEINGRTVTVRGSACDRLQDGAYHALSVKVLCEVVTPL